MNNHFLFWLLFDLRLFYYNSMLIKGEYNDILNGINAVVFLTYKPAGRGEESQVLKNEDDIDAFMKAIVISKCSCKI